MITYKDLEERLPELYRSYTTLLQNVKGRGATPPELLQCKLSQEESPDRYIARIKISIREYYPNATPVFRKRLILHFDYSIAPSGECDCVKEIAWAYMAAETVYRQPLQGWLAWLAEDVSRKRIQERATCIHEELVANVWHPRRVAQRLEDGGWDLIDSL